MEEHVSGIRDRFYHDLILDYNNKGESCCLYKFTWTENTVELLKKLKKKYQVYFPDIATEAPKGPEDFRARLEEAMESCTKEQIQKVLEQELQTERQDLWQQLWIRDAYYRMEQRSHGCGKPKDFGNDNFLWLVRYLAERDKYYRESSPAMIGGDTLPEQLYRIAKEGLRDSENAPNYELHTKEGRLRRDKLKNSLIKLAEQLENEGDSGETVSRLRRLGLCGQLWKLLERKLIHMKIKNWFQDSGFPLRYETDSDPSSGNKKEPRKYPSPKGDRKQDFTMRLFEAYCDSEDGYDFARKDKGGAVGAKGWNIDINGFCVMEVDGNRLAALVKALEKKARKGDVWNHCYIPLAVHLYSGCVFFLAGSGVYEDLYHPPQKEQFEEAKEKGKFCFDYLRLDKDALEDSWFVGSSFRLRPSFHENVIKDYGTVLKDFKRYCITVVQEAVSEYNEDCGGAPKVFRWAFCKPEEDDFKPSPAAEAAISKDRKDWKQAQRGS